MTNEDWERLAQAYRDYVPPEPVVDTDPEVAKRREAARHAIGSLYTGGRRPSVAFLVLTERWVAGLVTTDEAIAEIKGIDRRQTPPPPVTPEERWTAGLIDGDQLAAEMKQKAKPE